ncbi:hypothetical protein AR9_g211 [Bacillus phage AR9]|uniref:Uncharacterized protein n=2 Tax=Bacillus phage PBS1 TaxID=10683 RepID=A0A172JIA4_BPPB1|nr:hypothetical protein BI022_gp210 [Bacillus phage AR9]YP_009664304.1 hypothetical protein FK780_gp102 [Bacillus phage PBS1]WCS68339.1 hypothetical protein Goe21_02290 [Bacillus phage vB_BsuM-Goe21]AMS01295.1 hypothetical protein AR9_g211 [Bacillus phage AR9]AST99924.1 hypothetical protein PBI_PBS1_102 [Bacillus phage PBS1]BDE75257.1 hypothetical protein [Bacillus phage PBS1]
METFSSKNTKFRKRRFNQSLGFSEVLSEGKKQEEVFNESVINNIEETNNEVAFLAGNKRARQKRARLIEKKQFESQQSKELLEHFLSSVVYNALPLDEDVKKLNKEYMTKQVKGITDNLISNGTFEMVKSTTMQSVMESIEYHIEKMFPVKDNEEDVKIVSESFNKDIKTYVEYVSEVITNKVVNVVKTERDIAVAISESESPIKPKDTLFKNLQVQNVKMALKENEKTEVDQEILEQAMAESLFDYTLLETLNTLRLVEFDGEQLRKALPRFFNK